ncbi:hypothetical protein Tsubulata_045578 [Turnera subulata]|uniref:Cystatin domain-containing protein n=1 Tax=Turnera subulata TaxID=218843 RepID=A0A9Q0JIU1_9ROSI|nr:hypothetical protein Tsubulata_045578 [Turnera subulata]
MAAVTSASGSMYLQSPPPPPEIPPRKKAKVAVEVEEEGPEGYSVFEGKYDYGESLFSDLDCVEEEEDGLYILYVVHYDYGDKPREKVSAYMKQIAESEGFDIDDSPDAFIGSIRPLDKEALHNELDCQDLMECLNYAIAENNANSEKSYLDLVSVKKANYLGCAGFIYYITFVVKHVDLGKNFTFQAKVYSGLGEHKEVLIFRPLYKPSAIYGCGIFEYSPVMPRMLATFQM